MALAQQSANPRVYVLGRKRGTNVFRPRTPESADDESFPGLLLVRMEGRVFFLNAERIAEQLRLFVVESKPQVVVLDLSGVFDLEYSALKMLIDGREAAARSRAYRYGWPESHPRSMASSSARRWARRLAASVSRTTLKSPSTAI